MTKTSRYRATAANPWSLAWQAWSLGMEASWVIALRTMKIAAGGPQALQETQRMFAEKTASALTLQGMAASGGLGSTGPAVAARTLRHYRGKVRANSRRLSKS